MRSASAARSVAACAAAGTRARRAKAAAGTAARRRQVTVKIVERCAASRATRQVMSDARPSRFEGIYGAVYDRVIRADAVRRLAPLAYGPVPRELVDLDLLANAIVAAQPGTLLDVPCGGGSLWPRLERAGFAGRVVGVDLAGAMLRRAAGSRGRPRVELVRGDAQALDLSDAAVDAAVSLNGLHCLPDPQRFVGELARVVRPGGHVWLLTLVSGGTRRADAVVRAGIATGILAGAPPTRATLLRWLAASGLALTSPPAGDGLVALAAVRSSS